MLGDDCGLGVTSLLAASSASTAVTDGMPGVAAVMLRQLASRVVAVDGVADAVAAYGCMAESSFVLVNGGGCNDIEAAADAAVAAIEAGGIVVVRSLDTAARSHAAVAACGRRDEVGRTFSNGKTGIIVARKHLPRQDFSLWF